ncbi:hypothetical protein PQR33_28145 [Paraburkholderia sediminicola]|uniref:TubC N-terminal docking domain-related protein n=1 Tax=Paraburkholderia sediminicola TaxID=458836 RepID=UPI0038BAEE3B
MNISALIEEAKAAGVRVYLRDGKVKLRGPAEAMEAVKPKLAAHKPEILAYLSQAAGSAATPPDGCSGALMGDGPYLPWGPYLTPRRLKEWQRELFEIVNELARLERWPDDLFDHVVYCVERQPVSTLRPDLAHFQSRLAAARAEQVAREAVLRRSWRFE